MRSPLRSLARARTGDIGLGLTTKRLIAVSIGVLVVLNALNAYAFLQRPWQDRVPEESGWLLMAFEGNPSTWATAVALVAAAMACVLMARTVPAGTVDRRRWYQLALVPAFLSVDEVAELHERMGDAVSFDGGLEYGWVVPAAGIVAALAAVFARFVWRQGAFVRRVLVGAGALVVAGGMVIEAVNGELDGRGTASWIYLLSTTAEENVELLGILVVVVGLVEAAARRDLRLSVTTG